MHSNLFPTKTMLTNAGLPFLLSTMQRLKLVSTSHLKLMKTENLARSIQLASQRMNRRIVRSKESKLVC